MKNFGKSRSRVYLRISGKNYAIVAVAVVCSELSMNQVFITQQGLYANITMKINLDAVSMLNALNWFLIVWM